MLNDLLIPASAVSDGVTAITTEGVHTCRVSGDTLQIIGEEAEKDILSPYARMQKEQEEKTLQSNIRKDKFFSSPYSVLQTSKRHYSVIATRMHSGYGEGSNVVWCKQSNTLHEKLSYEDAFLILKGLNEQWLKNRDENNQ